MPLRLPMVWSDLCLSHVPGAEIWLGVRTPGTEVPERASVLRDAVVAAGGQVVAPAGHDDTVLASVHDSGLLAHLATCYDDWVAAGFLDDPGQDRVVPYVFPTTSMLGDLPARAPRALAARTGMFCYDTMTLVGPGTWIAARAAADCAQTAADLVLDGGPLVYAVCRPPGHHVTRDGYGGSCYLNNAAVAVETLRRGGAARVAVVDLDAHHGNGTQSIFYDRGDVFYASVHVDPAAGWFPHYAGFADEVGVRCGNGTTLNAPLAPGTGDAGWLREVERLRDTVAAWRPDALVVSLGVDAAGDDPESPLRVSEDGFRRSGALLHGLTPTVVVHEGGYHLPTLGALTVAALEGLAGLP